MPDSYGVPVLDPTGGIGDGSLEAWEEGPNGEEQVLLRLKLGESEWSAQADDYFSALVSLRIELEKVGMRLLVYGASKDVYPSPMSRSMGSGEKAYRLKMGEQARTADLVSIFATGPDIIPASVAEQEAFYASWLPSLRK